jgi:hypothetical protein
MIFRYVEERTPRSAHGQKFGDHFGTDWPSSLVQRGFAGLPLYQAFLSRLGCRTGE